MSNPTPSVYTKYEQLTGERNALRAERDALAADNAALRVEIAQWRGERDALVAELAEARHEFKNFHRLLCERFGYHHDQVDWSRDQLSLIEHIARQRDDARAEFTRLAERYNEQARLETEHCKDCCCARSWRALGIETFTGKSIPEHIADLRAENERLRYAMKFPYEIGRKWWTRHSTPKHQSWDFLPTEKRALYMLKAIAEIAESIPLSPPEMTMATDEKIEQEIQAKGLNAPRITPQLIDDTISAQYTFTAYNALGEGVPRLDALKLLTIAVLVLKNGFTVTGESACASPENFDAELGAKIAVQNAKAKIWALEGYLLKSKLAGV